MRCGVAIAVALAGCGGGGRAGDAGVDIDAFVRTDAAPSCGISWGLVPAAINDVQLLDPAPLNSARTTRALVTVEVNECDERAMFTVSRTFESKDVIIEARAWRPIGIDCPPSTQIFDRPVALTLESPGSWTIHAGTATPIVVDIGVPPARPCTIGDGCELDCDCPAGEVCLGGNGFAGPFTACARPCELDRDCDGHGSCITATDGLAFHCDTGIAECNTGKPCPTGYECSSNTCALEPTLGAATRKPCACDAECDPPLRCVEPTYPGRTRHCEVTCETAGGWCNGPHYCGTAEMDVAATAPADSVCVWAGD